MRHPTGPRAASFRRLALSAAAAALLAAPALAGKYNEVLDLGDPAPAFSGLTGVDGKTYSLADFKDKDVLVVVFTCNHCPVAQAYVDRFNKFTADYQNRGVGFLAVSVSTDAADTPEKMREMAAAEGIKWNYVYDGSQQVGKRYGAVTTPQVFVFDKKRNLAYTGAWDDEWKSADEVKRTYARDAVDALLDGRRPKVAETRQFGCAIAYE